MCILHFIVEQPFPAVMKGLNQIGHSNMNFSPVPCTCMTPAAGKEAVFFTLLHYLNIQSRLLTVQAILTSHWIGPSIV